MEAIVAIGNKFGIGKDGQLPWKVPEDLQHFKQITTGNVVVMGRKTYDSLSSRLDNRTIIVITNQNRQDQPNILFRNFENAKKEIEIFQGDNKKIIISGGEQIYQLFMPQVKVLHLTQVITSTTDYDSFFPMSSLTSFKLVNVKSTNKQCNFLTFERTDTPSEEFKYLDLLSDIMTNGEFKKDRTGTGTKSVFARQVRFDISQSFPILTTKFVPWRSIIQELLWFVRGDTNAQNLAKYGVNIWKQNTTREFLDSRSLFKYDEGDLGPMYGFVWRHAGAEYSNCKADYKGKGKDQLSQVLRLLKEEPDSRRIIMTTYDPNILDQGVLHPCHGLVVQFYVENGKYLNCHMYQRSMDTFLGAVWNIASYSALTYILAAKTGLQPKELVISTGDTHVYSDHFDCVEQQLARTPLPLPKMVINESVKTKEFEDITIDDFELFGYFYHPQIKANMSV